MTVERRARRRGTIAVAIWLIGVALCALVVGGTRFTTDLSAFLPQHPTKEQQLLLDQLRNGMVSRLILVGLEGGDADTRAALSKAMAQRLRSDAADTPFTSIDNGEPINAQRDQAYLFGNRYLLSPAVTPARFTVDGLHAAIADSIDLLASPAGLMLKSLLPRDPTGEIVQLVDQLQGGHRPRMQAGAWASRDGQRALLLAQTRATGSDIDAQETAIAHIRQAFAESVAKANNAAAVRLVMTGPGVFAVASRDTIKQEVTRLSILSTLLIVGLLLLVYRSVTALVLGLLPVASGALAGIAAVSLGFGMVHGITLGFGSTLIGEAVDYSIYLFLQSRQAGASANTSSDDWTRRFWPTIRLGVLTSVVGFSSLLPSGFPGLAQLGLYSIAGLIAAALVTRFVLPLLLPARFRIRDLSVIGQRLQRLATAARSLRWLVLLAALGAGVVLFLHRTTLWNHELAALSPISKADQRIDAALRADIGAPDVRYLIVVSGDTREAVLTSSEQVSTQLQTLMDKGVLAAFESPSRYLPSIATQRARQAALPGSDAAQRLRTALAGLPLRADALQPFLADLAAAKQRLPLQRADLDGTSLALAVDALLMQQRGRWTALMPLTAAGPELDAGAIRTALQAAGQPNALFVDMKAESDKLYWSYLQEALWLSLAGLVAICVLLLCALRSLPALLRVMLPLAAAVVVVTALLVLCGQQLIILHLIGLLLVVAVGSNYALFFNHRTPNETGDDAVAETGMAPQTLVSLLFANLTTVAGFGLLGFSSVPVLQAIGATVGPGAVLALLFSAALAR